MEKIKLYTEEQLIEACLHYHYQEQVGLDISHEKILDKYPSKITASAAIKEFIDDESINEIPVIFPSRKTDFSSYKHYRRFPIQLGAQSIILIHHFDNVSSGFRDSFEGHDFSEENDEALKYGYKQNEIAAEQFFDQLEGHYSDAFLEALIIEATKNLDKGDLKRFKLSHKLKKDDVFDNRAKKALDKAIAVLYKIHCGQEDKSDFGDNDE